MKHIAQFRYRGTRIENSQIIPDPENYPTNLVQDMLVTGNIFRGYGPVSQLGIQAPVGMKFYLNNSNHPIMIGETGIYELDLENVGRITAIRFDKDDLERFYNYDEGYQSDKILIDIVYEGVSGV